MATTYHFRCDTCTYGVNICYLPREYVLDQGCRLDVQQRHVWCCVCGEVTPAEIVTRAPGGMSLYQQEIDECRRELDDVGDDWFYRKVVQDRLQAAVQRAHGFATWVAMRKAPTRCLKCGNTDIAVPDSDWSDLPHPPCGGQLRCTATLVCGMFPDVSPHGYTPEGELIEVGKRHTFGGTWSPLELWGDARASGSE
jgi:hypothetical protein